VAVQQGQDRRVGGDPEKLLTLEEAAKRLLVSPDDVEQMIQRGRLASFRLGGHLLRVRLGDVERLRAHATGSSASASRSTGLPTRKRSGLGRFWDRVLDFFYFNDFYLVALLLLLTLIALILAL
jgi:excisionase family DNA binding protein